MGQRIREMNWIQRKNYLYNVTFGLFMLDWWERYLFNTLVIVLMWFIFYNGSRFLMDFCKRYCRAYDYCMWVYTILMLSISILIVLYTSSIK